MAHVGCPPYLLVRPAHLEAGPIRAGTATSVVADPSRPRWAQRPDRAGLLKTKAMNVLTHALRVWAQHRAFRTVFAKLARLSERELRDMGIDRGDLTRIAYQEAAEAAHRDACRRQQHPCPRGLQLLPAGRRVSDRCLTKLQPGRRTPLWRRRAARSPQGTPMANLATAYLPSLLRDTPDAADGLLGRLVLLARQKIRYRRALNELHRLDDRDLDDLGIGRGDFQGLAKHHATGLPPLARPYS
jgi:uncharacterized protein YjiS (DUF1127 family)